MFILEKGPSCVLNERPAEGKNTLEFMSSQPKLSIRFTQRTFTALKLNLRGKGQIFVFFKCPQWILMPDVGWEPLIYSVH